MFVLVFCWFNLEQRPLLFVCERELRRDKYFDKYFSNAKKYNNTRARTAYNFHADRSAPIAMAAALYKLRGNWFEKYKGYKKLGEKDFCWS